MNGLPELPAWAALSVAFLVLVGATFTLIGSIGLARLRSFYDRTHAPTIGSSYGTAFICLASIICFSALGSRLAIQEVLIFLFVTVTMPITLMLLARAALFRDRTEGKENIPPAADNAPKPRDEG